MFAYLIDRTQLLSAHRDFFVFFVLYKYSYLLTDQFFVDKYLWQFYGITFKPRGWKIFARPTRPECCKDTHMKAYDKYDKYVEYWHNLKTWATWSFKVIENGTIAYEFLYHHLSHLF